jgi:hypothetical protein
MGQSPYLSSSYLPAGLIKNLIIQTGRGSAPFREGQIPNIEERILLGFRIVQFF